MSTEPLPRFEHPEDGPYDWNIDHDDPAQVAFDHLFRQAVIELSSLEQQGEIINWAMLGPKLSMRLYHIFQYPCRKIDLAPHLRERLPSLPEDFKADFYVWTDGDAHIASYLDLEVNGVRPDSSLAQLIDEDCMNLFDEMNVLNPDAMFEYGTGANVQRGRVKDLKRGVVRQFRDEIDEHEVMAQLEAEMKDWG